MENSEGLKYIKGFLDAPPKDEEIKLDTLKSVTALLVGNKSQLEGVRSLNSFLMGGVISHLKENEIWKKFPGVEEWWQFGEFVERTFDFSLKKADALERVWKRATKFSMPSEVIEEVGWSTADTILRFASSKEEVVELTEKCKSSPTKMAFVANLRDERGDTAHGRAVFQKHLRFTREEAAAYDNALQEFARSAKKELHVNMRAEEAILSVLVLWKTAVDEAKMLSDGR